jgi:anti-anti-sigma regulatory factor
MAVQIKEEFGILKVLGVLNSETARLTSDHVNTLLETKERVLVSLEGVLSIDRVAAKSMEKLYTTAARNNKVLSIFGRQNANISEVLQATNTNYILSSDRE